ncbi:MAG: hypothetical protein JWM04_1469 [Verrucomicrobiales bacterium]|jgi:hypothetical protein|nr:hypothetical protein [Verrucomicrobiales bacterium]
MQGRRYILGFLCYFLVFYMSGCVRRFDSDNRLGSPTSYPLTKSTPDTNAVIILDSAKPFKLRLGYGGWGRLSTITIDQKGKTVWSRARSEVRRIPIQGDVNMGRWVKADFKLSPESVQCILASVDKLKLLQLDRAYYAAVFDGAQWIFEFEQGSQTKSIYFSNHFPREIQTFAQLLQAEFKKSGVDKVHWSDLPDGSVFEAEQILWNSIK